MQRPLLLTGMMATGKSSVGRLVSEQTGRAFFDLDAEIERVHGAPVAAIFSTQGEAFFRALEKKTLLGLLEGGGAPVVSLGGGALLDRELRVEVLGQAVVVCLTAEPEEIQRRAQAQDASGTARPLLSGSAPEAKILELLAQRREGYQECHGQLKTDGRSPAELAEQAISLWKKDAVVVAAGADSYSVLIGPGLIAAHLSELVGSPSGAVLVTDTNVAPLHAARVRPALAELPVLGQALLTPGEEHKNLEGLAQIMEAAFTAHLDRKGIFVGLGGGVVTDMTGFAAATWVRGVEWIGCPTTLLSMVDASVGGKTAVDFKTAKNSVGAFWQPRGVICDVETLTTESERMFVGALSEVVKTALIGDPALLELLEDQTERVLARDPDVIGQIVERSVRVKARIVSLDPREQGIRATLNLGHTIGHALESSGGYSALTHGEAVSLGLVAALRLGRRMGHTPKALETRVVTLLQRLGLPFQLSRAALTQARDLIGHDKKRAGSSVTFVFARGLGDVFTQAVPLAQLIEQTPELCD